VQCLVDEQTEFEHDALGNMQPMQVVANQWRHVVTVIAREENGEFCATELEQR